jgi:hypothetical protein
VDVQALVQMKSYGKGARTRDSYGQKVID